MMTNSPIQIKYRLSVQQLDGRSFSTHTARRGHLVHLVHMRKWQRACLQVVYHRNQVEVSSNEGEYDSVEDLLDALKVFTGADLVEFLA